MSGISENYSLLQKAEQPSFNLSSLEKKIESFVENSNKGFLSRENIIDEAKKNLEEIDSLTETNIKRNCWLRLLKIPIEEIQLLVFDPLYVSCGISSLKWDIENETTDFYISLEKETSLLINENTRHNGSELLLVNLLFLYAGTLEKLFLLSHLGHNPAFVQQHAPEMISRTQEWSNLLLNNKVKNEKKLDLIEQLNLLLIQLNKSLPTSLKTSIETIRKNLENDLVIEIEVGKICAELKVYERLIFHFELAISVLPNEKEASSEIDSVKLELLIFLIKQLASNNYHERAEPFILQAIELANKLNEHTQEMTLWSVRAYCLDSPIEKGDFIQKLQSFEKENDESLIECYEKILDIAKKLNDIEKQKETFFEFSRIYLRSGEYKKSADAIENLINLKKSDEAIYVQFGRSFSAFGFFEAALIFLKKGLELAQDPSIKMALHFQCSKTYNHLGNFEASESHLEEAKSLTKHFESLEYDILEEKEEHEETEEFLTNLADKLIEEERYHESIIYYEKALALDPNPIIISTNLLSPLIQAYLKTGQLNEAINILEKSLLGYEKNGLLTPQAKTSHLLAIFYLATNNIKEAKSSFFKSIKSYFLIQKGLRENSELTITFLEQRSQPFIHFESFLLKQDQMDEALQTSESRRADALLNNILKKLIQKEVDLSKMTFLDPSSIKELAKQQQVSIIFYSLCVDPNLISDEIHDIPHLHVWVITPHLIRNKELTLENLKIDQKEINDLFAIFPFYYHRGSPQTPSFIKDLEFSRSGKIENKAENRKHQKLNLFKIRLEEWYATFIEPIESWLPKNHPLMIIPDNFLAHLPFAAFRNKKGKYLIEDYPISYLSSLRVLNLLNKYPHQFASSSLVLGNPTTPYNQPLDLAEKEASEIVSKILQTPQDHLFLKEKATISNLKEKIKEACYIHLACHGEEGQRKQPSSIFEGRLLLTPEEGHKEGFLYAEDIIELDLNADLVFLSSCFSGTGNLMQEGSMGQVWSFLGAGARSVVATKWELPETEFTLTLIKEFYEQLIHKKVSKTGALRQMMLKAIETERESPDKWAAFFLTGLPT